MMADTKAKFFHIMEILLDTDEEHPKTAVQISKILDEKYGIAAERKSICRDINVLRGECEMDIVQAHDNKDGFFLASRTFEDWQLKFLIDAVLASKTLAEKDARDLVEKLRQQGSPTSRQLLSQITPVAPQPVGDRRKVKNYIDAIMQAIRANRQIAFQYLHFDIEKQQKPRRDRRYQVSPYALVRKGDNYYLICNYSKYDNLSYYRLERMGSLHILNDVPRKPLKEFFGAHERTGLTDFVHQSLYSWTGEPICLHLKFPSYELDDIIDQFGRDVELKPLEGDFCEGSVKVQAGPGLYFWLMQRADNVQVLAPQAVREKLVRMLKNTLALYEQSEE